MEYEKHVRTLEVNDHYLNMTDQEMSKLELIAQQAMGKVFDLDEKLVRITVVSSKGTVADLIPRRVSIIHLGLDPDSFQTQEEFFKLVLAKREERLKKKELAQPNP